MVRLELTLLPDEAALILQAIEKARDGAAAAARQRDAADVSAETPKGTQRSADPRRWRRPPGASASWPPVPAPSPHPARDRAAGRDRYQVIVHLDQDVLAPDGAHGRHPGRRHPRFRGNVPPHRLRRRPGARPSPAPTVASAAGSAGVLDIGRRTRTIPAAIRRALWIRDRGCRFPGCPHTRFLHGHHIRHWLHGGRTSLNNLVLLCPRHHRAVHEDGFAITIASDGGLVFRSPERHPLVPNPARATIEAAAQSLQEWAAEREIEITPATNLPWWDGAIPDYDWTVSSLLD